MPYSPRTKPMLHQLVALERVAGRPRQPSSADVFAWLMDTGTGKSKVVVDEWGSRWEPEKMDLLLTAPAGCFENWVVDRGNEEPSELRKHLDPSLLDRTRWAIWGGQMTRRRACFQLLEYYDGPCVLVINAEAFSVTQVAMELAEAFLRRRRTMMVVDESTVMRHHTSKRSMELARLGALAWSRRIASGLVTPNSPLALYSQFNFLDWRIIGSRSYTEFKLRYAVVRRFTTLDQETLMQRVWRYPASERADVDLSSREQMFDFLQMRGALRKHEIHEQVVDYKNLEELREKIAPYSYRVMKEDCLDLPPRTYLRRNVRLTKEQTRMYEEMRRTFNAELEGQFVTANMVVTMRMRLDQILCGIGRSEEGEEFEIPEHRTEVLMDLLREHQRKAVVWTTHDLCVRRIAKAIRDEYGEESVACFWGGNRSTRSEDERRFKTDPRCRFMCATPGAGGKGNTWTMGDLNVYYNNDDDLEHRLQSEDRVYRHGQSLPVTNVDLIAEGTIDVKKVHNLRAKLDVATLINGDNYREWLI